MRLLAGWRLARSSGNCFASVSGVAVPVTGAMTMGVDPVIWLIFRPFNTEVYGSNPVKSATPNGEASGLARALIPAHELPSTDSRFSGLTAHNAF